MSNERQRTIDIKVGLFVALGLVLLTISIFLIGQERHLFEKPVYLRAHFPNVAGLKVGAPVRLAGFDVGIVSAIELPKPDPSDETIIIPTIDLPEETPDLFTLPLAGPVVFPTPRNVILTAFDRRSTAELMVRITGIEGYGPPDVKKEVTETLRLRVRDGRDSVPSHLLYREVHKIELREIKGNQGSTRLQVGAGIKKVTVVLRITSSVLDQIRLDSMVHVDSMGLLGDKTMDIAIGSRSQPGHRDGDFIKSAHSLDINTALADAQATVENLKAGTEDMARLIESFTAAGGEEALVAASRSIQGIAEEIRTGKGLLHQLVYDPKGGQQYNDIVSNIASVTKKVDSGLGQVDKILGEVRNGDGLVHALLYGKDGDKTVTQAREALAQATQILDDVRTKKGVIHNLIYDEDRGEFITNLNDATADVKIAMKDVHHIVADVKAGKGSLGGLITDPTVYEDLKVLLGNVRRSDAVKSLVRAAIAQEDKKAQAPVKSK
jgi:phospholipid/cholesterol/gamma-HCH transport system substrate-binding protein